MSIAEKVNDSEALLEQTSTITRNLKYIEESDVSGFDELLEQTSPIAANQKVIREEA